MTPPNITSLAHLQKQAKDLQAQIDAYANQTAAPAPSPIQPNTYVAQVSNGEVHLVTQVKGTLILFGLDALDSQYLRPATNSEILAHLIKEADKRGIRPGVSVKEDIAKSGYSSSKTWKIAEMTLIATEQEAVKSSGMVVKCWNALKRPILISSSYGQHFPIDWVDAVPEKPALSITVDGQTYTPTFKEGYVEFGCALIANEVIVAAHELTSKHLFAQPVMGNRYVTSIRIGKGDFSPELLKGLTEEIRAREAGKDPFDYYVENDGKPFGGSHRQWYVRHNRQTGLCEQIDLSPFTAFHNWTAAPYPTWVKLPNRAAAEALLRSKT